MNFLRIRAVKLAPMFGADDGLVYAVQISQDGLTWWTLERHLEFTDAMESAKALEDNIRTNFTVRATHVLWSTKI